MFAVKPLKDFIVIFSKLEFLFYFDLMLHYANNDIVPPTSLGIYTHVCGGCVFVYVRIHTYIYNSKKTFSIKIKTNRT